MAMFNTGTFIVDTDGAVEVDYLYDGGWFRGELAVFSLEGMEDLEPGTSEFIKEAARRALTDSEQGRILVRDEIEGAKFSAELPWERDFNTGDYQGIKAFNLTPGDEVALMLVQHTTVENIWQNPNRTSQFGKIPLFSIPEANPTDYSSSDGSEIVDVDGKGAIAWEDVPIKQADRDYNDLIVDIQGLDGNLPTLSDNINPTRDWRKSLVLGNEEIMTLSADDLVMHLELNDTFPNRATDSAPEGINNQGTLQQGAKFHQGIVNFDGKNDLIEIQDSPDINLDPHAQRTISVWFKVDDKNLRDKPDGMASLRKQIIYEEGGVRDDNGGLNIYIENGRIYFGGWNGESWSGTYLSTNNLFSNTWHHAALVLDAQEGVETTQPKAFTAYLDGLNIGTGAGTQLESRRDDIGIGGLNETTRFHDRISYINEQHSLAGSIEDVRVYNRALDPGEISFLADRNYQPLAIDDQKTTVENTEIILDRSSLLANDTDLNGDSLSLIAIGNVVNGSMAADTEGQLIFTPDPGFSGDASFEYTVSDDRGGTDTATVNVTVLPNLTSIPVGTNLHRLADWSPQLPFLDAFKFARRWIPQNWIPATQGWYKSLQLDWNTGEYDLLDLDENGWVKSLPASEDEPEYNSVGTVMFRDVGEYPAGKYVVLYEGEGTIEYGLDATKDESASTPGRDVIDVEPTNSGIWLRITETDPQDTGNYLRDLKVLPEEYEYAQGQIFNPEFLKMLEPFDTLRFMDWMATNNSQQGEWSERPTPDNSLFFGEIASVEAMVELANSTDTDPWFTLPHMATDEYVTNFAQYVRDNLDPELDVYVEYSNEVWGDLGQGWWVEQQGREEFAESAGGNFAKRMDWYSQRTTEITQMWDEVFDTDKERVIGVISAQAANLWTAEKTLEYAWADNPLSHEEYGIDAIAIGPYFGRYIGKPHFQTEIESWIDSDDPDLALDNLFAEVTQGGVLTNAPKNGALEQAYDWTKAYVDLAESENLDLLSYETSQHLVGINGVQQNQAVSDLFIAANHDPRMGKVYQEYFTTLDELGIDKLINHIDISGYNKFGSWGSMENLTQPNTPKYNALKSLTGDRDLSPQLSALNHNLGEAEIMVEGDILNLNVNYTDVDLTKYHTVAIDWGDGSPVEVIEQEPLLGEVGNVSDSHVYDIPGIYNPVVTIADDDNLANSKSLDVRVAKKVAIAIYRGSNTSEIDLTGDGSINVAILGSSDFDPATVNLTSVRAGDRQSDLLDGRDVSAIGNDFRLVDTNSDGWQDLEISFTKSSLRDVVDENSEPFMSRQQIYLFGSSSSSEGGLFFGMEEQGD